MSKKNIFLFSIDLEDPRENVVDGNKYEDRVVANTTEFLDWLNKNKFTCTFFTVGKIAEKYPDLIKQIAKDGHEIACHSYSHIPLPDLGKDAFKKDIEKNLNALIKAGASDIVGFRAPVFSLTKNCEWAYNVLNEFKFTYSSSVLPAKNPLYGWEGFGEKNKVMDGGIIEMPMTISKVGPLNIPVGGGTYFRVLPGNLIRNAFRKKFENGLPVLGYFHPYDIDTKQEHYMHAGINDNKFFNWLMYYNRKTVFHKLNKLSELDTTIITYKQFAENIRNGLYF